MVLERDIGTLTEAQHEDTDKAVNHHYFVRIESPVGDFGTLRFTTRINDWVGSLDAANGEGSSASWRGGEVAPGDLHVSQTNTSILDVSTLSFPNVRDEVETATGYWLNLDLTYGLKNRKVTIWQAWWLFGDDADDAIEDTYVLFKGRIGAREHGERSNLSLLPFRSSWNIKTGSQLLPSVCRFAVAGLFKDPTSCQYAGAETECDGSLTTCIVTMNNEINFGGHPAMLKPNTVIQIGPSTQRQRFNI